MIRRLVPVLALLTVLPLAGCSSSPAAPTAESVHGTMTLGVASFNDNVTVDTDNPADVAGDDCTAVDGYGDIASGAEVDIVDGAGKVLAIGNLGDGKVTSDTYGCQFDFTVPDVPMGGSIYGVKVGNGNRGIVHFSKAQMFGGGGPALSLG